MLRGHAGAAAASSRAPAPGSRWRGGPRQLVSSGARAPRLHRGCRDLPSIPPGTENSPGCRFPAAFVFRCETLPAGAIHRRPDHVGARAGGNPLPLLRRPLPPPLLAPFPSSSPLKRWLLPSGSSQRPPHSVRDLGAESWKPGCRRPRGAWEQAARSWSRAGSGNDAPLALMGVAVGAESLLQVQSNPQSSSGRRPEVNGGGSSCLVVSNGVIHSALYKSPGELSEPQRM